MNKNKETLEMSKTEIKPIDKIPNPLEPIKQTTPQKELKDMTDRELANHYKSLFLKSKKLIVHYEDELKQLTQNISSVKDKLKEYESGKFFSRK